jgi:hypothetical protein
MELAGLEPATSWVRCGHTQRTESVDLLAVPHSPGRSRAQSRVLVCRGLSGLWSAQTAARTSGGAALAAAPLPPEPERSEEVNLKD